MPPVSLHGGPFAQTLSLLVQYSPVKPSHTTGVSAPQVHAEGFGERPSISLQNGLRPHTFSSWEQNNPLQNGSHVADPHLHALGFFWSPVVWVQ